MRTSLLEPKPHAAALILRLGLAAIFVVHGSLKIRVGVAVLPDVSVATQEAVGWAELVCGLLLAVGLFSRLAALVVIGLQVAAIALVSGKYAMDIVQFSPSGRVDFTRVGPEYNLVLIAMCLGVIVLGSGYMSLDHLIVSRWRRKVPAAVAPPVPPQPAAGPVA